MLVISERGFAKGCAHRHDRPAGNDHRMPDLELSVSNLPQEDPTAERGPSGPGGTCCQPGLLRGKVTVSGTQSVTQDGESGSSVDQERGTSSATPTLALPDVQEV